MKRTFGIVILMSMILSLSGCLSTEVDDNNPKSVKNSVGTPENSVLVYGFYSDTSSMYFSQMDPNYPADFRSFQTPTGLFATQGAFCLGPVAPGSRYACTYIYSTDVRYIGNTRYTTIYQIFGSLQGTIFDINVPKQTGLYYIGGYNAPASMDKGKKIKYEALGMDDKSMELICLKGIKDFVKGTAWEAPVNQRIEELSK